MEKSPAAAIAGHQGLEAMNMTEVHCTPQQPESTTTQAYLEARSQILAREKALDFDYACRENASSLEKEVDSILRRLRDEDQKHVYDAAAPRHGVTNQQHARYPGDHFLSNVGLIEQTAMFDVATSMPKGAHLHIHYNSCLPPGVLLDVAKDMDCMFIMSDLPLLPDQDYESFARCEIRFSIIQPEKERPGDLFSSRYQPWQTMRYREFRDNFRAHCNEASVDDWLRQKLVFDEREAHDALQNPEGAWALFNSRTRMMKGLFNYETAFRRYTRLFLEDLMRDNIQYAEIRPTFMMTNQLHTDDGSRLIDNYGIMAIIVEEVTRFKEDMRRQSRCFIGIKVIYCTPRSFERAQIKAALDECLVFKKRLPQWIAGFDLVGEESKGHPLSYFITELLNFQQKCEAANLDIPFLFHCGETLDIGSDIDGNLVDALLLKSKRIGHGFALSKHPYIMQQMKTQGTCVELCPISNEILGLTPRISGHTMYELLANNVHCTVSSDNGTLFRSSLSHDFYQVMIGKGDMGLFGWKQLILWSLEHACLDDVHRKASLTEWKVLWDKFLNDVVEKYGKDRR